MNRSKCDFQGLATFRIRSRLDPLEGNPTALPSDETSWNRCHTDFKFYALESETGTRLCWRSLDWGKGEGGNKRYICSTG